MASEKRKVGLDSQRGSGMARETFCLEKDMTISRLLAVALLLAGAICGCTALKNDPIAGDNPWQPGSPFAPKSTDAKSS
jgi:hypothetical protein